MYASSWSNAGSSHTSSPGGMHKVRALSVCCSLVSSSVLFSRDPERAFAPSRLTSNGSSLCGSQRRRWRARLKCLAALEQYAYCSRPFTADRRRLTTIHSTGSAYRHVGQYTQATLVRSQWHRSEKGTSRRAERNEVGARCHVLSQRRSKRHSRWPFCSGGAKPCWGGWKNGKVSLSSRPPSYLVCQLPRL